MDESMVAISLTVFHYSNVLNYLRRLVITLIVYTQKDLCELYICENYTFKDN